MEKLDFSDFYKFLVSVGLVFLFFAILVPWMFLSNPFDAAVKAADLSDLTPTGLLLVGYRQSTALWFLQNSGAIGGGLCLLGLALLAVGLVFWFRRQQVLDLKQNYETQKAFLDIKPVPAEEAERKSMEEMKLHLPQKNIDDTLLLDRYWTQNMFAKARVVELLRQAARQEKLRVMANVEVAGSPFDLIIEQRGPGGKMTWMVEVRRIPTRPTAIWTAKEAGRLLVKRQNYVSPAARNVLAILCVFTPGGCAPDERPESAEIQASLSILADQVRVVFLDEAQIGQWTPETCRAALLPA